MKDIIALVLSLPIFTVIAMLLVDTAAPGAGSFTNNLRGLYTQLAIIGALSMALNVYMLTKYKDKAKPHAAAVNLIAKVYTALALTFLSYVLFNAFWIVL